MNTTNPILFSIDPGGNWIGYFKQNDKLRRFIAWKSFDTVSKWILVTWFTGSGNFAMLGNLFGCGLYFPGLANKSVLHRKIPTNILLYFLVGFIFFFCLNRWLLILIFNIISKNRTGRSLRKLHFGRRIQVFPSSGNSLNAPAMFGAFDFDVPRRLLVLSAGSWTKGACSFWSGSYRILTNSKLEHGQSLSTMIIEVD